MFGLTLLASPLSIHAQPSARPARVGILDAASPTSFPDRMEAFRRGLAAIGYVEGKDVTFETRWAGGKLSDLPRLAEQLVNLNVDVIFAGTTATAVAAKRATARIPVVFAVPADPVGVGLVASFAKPGGNATGLTTANVETVPKRIELIGEMSGKRVSRIAVLYYPGDASNVSAWRAVESTSTRIGARPLPYPVASADEFDAAFTAMSKDGADVLMVSAGALTDSNARKIADLAAAARIPAMYGAREFVQAGGLISYSARFSDNYRRAAAYVDKILRGVDPADLPVEGSSIFELAVNRRAAAALKLSIPSSILLRADEVIE